MLNTVLVKERYTCFHALNKVRVKNMHKNISFLQKLNKFIQVKNCVNDTTDNFIIRITVRMKSFTESKQ